MAILSREEILGAEDRKFVQIEVPEWGGTVRIGVMTGRQRMALQMAMEKDRDGFIEQLVAHSLCDEEGRPIFTAADIEKLSRKSAAALERVFSVAADINGLTRKSIDDAAGKMTAQPELMFYYRLARELGMTVGRLLDECDSREISCWIAYFMVADGKFKPKTPHGMAEKFKALMGAQALKDQLTGKGTRKKGKK